MSYRILQGDAVELAADLEPASIHAIITSPPYWRARIYNDDPRQVGREDLHPETFAALLADILAALVPALVGDGVMLVNVGNVYAGGGYGSTSEIARGRRGWKDTMRDRGRRGAPFGYPEANLVLVAPMLIEAVRRRCGLYLRGELVWAKPTAGEPATILDRPPRRHEFIYILSKSRRSRLRDPGESWWQSDVWTISPHSRGPSTASMPDELARRLVLVSTRPGETVCDPFSGGGTTLLAADRLGRHGVGFELQPDLVAAARTRLAMDAPLFAATDAAAVLTTNGVVHDAKEVITTVDN